MKSLYDSPFQAIISRILQYPWVFGSDDIFFDFNVHEKGKNYLNGVYFLDAWLWKRLFVLLGCCLKKKIRK